MHVLRAVRERCPARRLPELRRRVRAATDPAGAFVGEIPGLDRTRGEAGRLRIGGMNARDVCSRQESQRPRSWPRLTLAASTATDRHPRVSIDDAACSIVAARLVR